MAQKSHITLLSDECIPDLINYFFKDNLVKIISVKDLKLIGEPDEIIFKKVLSLKLPLITLDIKFVGQIYQTQSNKYGVILLRYKGRVKEKLLLNIKKFITKEDLLNLAMKIIVIDEQKYRISDKSPSLAE